jgi:hypothetical protein
MADEIVIAVKHCARCGKDHLVIVFKPLRRPADDITHWASCPMTNEPILMMVKATR